jgi:hypothetical protein
VDDRPWEQPGALRRDCEPHRGRLLLKLGAAAYALGVVSAILFCLAPLAVLLGAGAWGLAVRDLTKMEAGVMDPGGRGQAEKGRRLGCLGLVAAVAGLCVWGSVLLYVAWLDWQLRAGPAGTP